jgi:hypothetical protein
MRSSHLAVAALLLALEAACPSLAGPLFTRDSAPRAHVAVLSIPIDQLGRHGALPVTARDARLSPVAQRLWITGTLPTRCTALQRSSLPRQGCLVV